MKPKITNLFAAKNYISKMINENNVYQIRYAIISNSAGSITQQNNFERVAMFQLSNEKKLRIIGKRKFYKKFEDGTEISGFNYTVIKEFHQGDTHSRLNSSYLREGA